MNKFLIYKNFKEKKKFQYIVFLCGQILFYHDSFEFSFLLGHDGSNSEDPDSNRSSLFRSAFERI